MMFEATCCVRVPFSESRSLGGAGREVQFGLGHLSHRRLPMPAAYLRGPLQAGQFPSRIELTISNPFDGGVRDTSADQVDGDAFIVANPQAFRPWRRRSHGNARDRAVRGVRAGISETAMD